MPMSNLTFTNHTGANIYVKKTNDKSKYLGLTTNELHTISNSSSLKTDKTDFSGTNKIIIDTDVLTDSYNTRNQSRRILDII